MKISENIIIYILLLILITSCSGKTPKLNPDSISDCNNIKDEDSRYECFIDYATKVAIFKEDEALDACKYINTSQLKDICLTKLIKKLPHSENRVMICKEMDDSSLRFKCLRSITRPHLTNLID